MNLIRSLKPGRRTRCHRSQGMLTRWRRPWAHTKALTYTSDVWAAIADRRWLRGRRDSHLGGNIFYWIQIICNSNRLIYNSQCLSNAPTIHVKYNYCHLVLIDAYAILSGIPPPDLDLGKSTRDDFWCSSSQSMTNESVPPHPGNNSSLKRPPRSKRIVPMKYPLRWTAGGFEWWCLRPTEWPFTEANYFMFHLDVDWLIP